MECAHTRRERDRRNAVNWVCTGKFAAATNQVYVGNIDGQISVGTKSKHHNTATNHNIHIQNRVDSCECRRHEHQDTASNTPIHVRTEDAPTKQNVPDCGMVRMCTARLLDPCKLAGATISHKQRIFAACRRAPAASNQPVAAEQ